MPYRTSRNFEASVIDFINEKLDATGSGWSNIRVEKSFSYVYDGALPCICVRVGTTEHTRAEIGGTSTYRTANILIDIFATSDGIRLDLKDWLIANIRAGVIYYNYTIVNGATDSKVEDGRINILNIDDVPIDFDMDKDKLDVADRYRHLITLSVSLGQIES